jgi:putative ABC transport system permease protein
MAAGRMMIPRLAWADLWHEWILSLCLILAVTAVISPLLLMFGIKYGTIETLRNRIIADPANREIRPQISKSFNHAWFKKMRARPEVAFVVPLTRQIAALIDMTPKSGGKPVRLDLLPSGEGDPLLLENGAPIPQKGQCVLSARAAEMLGAGKGDRIKASAIRQRGSRVERGNVTLEVVGVLGIRATELKAVYAPLPFLEKVEDFKDGRGVPSYGWKGSVPRAYPVYDGVFLWVRGGLNAVKRAILVNNTGFKKVQRLTRSESLKRHGLEPPTGWRAYYLVSGSRLVSSQSLQSVRHKLRGREIAMFPWVEELKISLSGQGGDVQLNARAFGLAEGSKPPPGFTSIPGWPEAGADPGKCRMIALPEGKTPPKDKARLSTEGISFDLEKTMQAPEAAEALIPHQLAGVLRLARQRDLTYEPGSGGFVLKRRGYAGFRLYAAHIDQVAGLGRELEAAGIPVHTQAKRISEVTSLDRYLTLIFWLIASVALAGGAAALAANLYGSVQRKQKELSILRLVGVSGSGLLGYPVYQGLSYALGGFLASSAIFGLLSFTINRMFQDSLRPGESLCRLPVELLFQALAGTLLVALTASIAAAWRVTRIDPAEALRDE